MLVILKGQRFFFFFFFFFGLKQTKSERVRENFEH